MKIIVDLETWMEWLSLARSTDTEVEWYHYSESLIANKAMTGLKIDSPMFIAKQVATGTTVRTEADDFADMEFRMEQWVEETYGDIETRIEQGIAVWPNTYCHSHVDMSVFFSGTDIKNMEEYMQNHSEMIGIVINKKEEFFGEYWFKGPNGCIHKIKLELEKQIPYYYGKNAKELVTEYVTKKVYPIYPISNYGTIGFPAKGDTGKKPVSEVGKTNMWSLWNDHYKEKEKGKFDSFIAWKEENEKTKTWLAFEFVTIPIFNKIIERIVQIASIRTRKKLVNNTNPEIYDELYLRWMNNTNNGIDALSLAYLNESKEVEIGVPKEDDFLGKL